MTALSGPSDIVSENAHSPAAGGARTVLVVPDAQLLFSADFKRSGPDLILTAPDGDRFTVLDYFRHKKLPDLATPDGATLGAKIIEALTGMGPSYQYAQATAPAPAAQVIGKVEKVTGSVTAIRNGVAVTLNVGDTLNKTDIVQTGSNSNVGISLLDGTALNLSANTRMALNEFIFDVNASTGNAGHLTLVQGAFAFVSGLVASTGGLNIETPVANIGIRGTVGGATCSDAGRCEYYAGQEVTGPNAGQPSTFALQAGGRYVNGLYIGGTAIASVTVGANAQVSATGVSAQPQVTFVPAAAADPGLTSLTQQLIISLPQFTPGPVGPQGPQAPQGPQTPQGPQSPNPQTGPSPGSSTPPPPDNGTPDNPPPLTSIPPTTQTALVAPIVTSPPETIIITTTDTTTDALVIQSSSQSSTQSEPSATTSTTIVTDSGQSPSISSGGVTKDNTLTLSGSVNGGIVSVEVTDGSTDLGSAAIDGSGSWSFTTGPLSEGTHSFTALATDTTGATITAGTVTAVVDTTPPVAPTISSVTDTAGPITGPVANGSTINDSNPAVTVGLSGTGAVAGDTIQLFDGSNPLGSPYIVTDTDVTNGSADVHTGILGDGTHSVTARIIDAAGNQSGASTAFAVTIDTAAPAAPVISAIATDSGAAGDHITNDTSLTISGTAAANSTVEVFQDGVSIGTTTASAGGAWSLADPNTLLNGTTYQFTATATDAASNTSSLSASYAVTIDTAAPAAVATVTALSSDTGTPGDFITSVAAQTVSGSYTGVLGAGEKIQVSADGTIWVDATAASGLWSASGVTLLAGSGTLLAQTVDSAGNTMAGTGHSYTLTITGDNNDNILVGTPGIDWIEGLGGHDTLQGFAGDDLLDGGSGIDRVIYTDAILGPITVDLAAGTVTGDASVGADTLVSIEQIRGSAFNDIYVATGYTGVSSIGSVSANFNEFEGMAGNDTIAGNSGTFLSYLTTTDGVTVNFTSWVAGQGASGTATGDASVGTDTFTGVQGVFGSQFADTFHGSNNVTGVEVFYGRGGNDFIDGGGGFDRANYWFRTDDNVTGGITVNMAAGTVIDDASVSTDTLRSIEAVRGTNFADTYDATGFSGSSTNAGSNGTFNEFEGLGGNDTITGNGNTRISYINATDGVTVDLLAGTAMGDASVGNDTFTGVNAIQGSYFADTLYGSTNALFTTEVFDGAAGDDTFDGRGGFDQAVYNVDLGTVSGISVDMAAGTVVGDASIGTDTLISIESVRGTNFADTYVATGFNGSSTNAGSNGTFNSFEGFAGNDVITGNGNTQLAFFSATAGVTVNFITGTATGDASVGTDTFTGVNNIQGTNFNDTMIGATGNQTLSGRGGTDTFVYADNGGADFVTDFSHGQGDQIDLTGVTGVASLADVQAIATQVGPNTVINFGGGNTLTLNNVSLASDFIFAPVNHIVGDSNGNILVGTPGVDWIEGLGGNDTLQGLGNNDLLDGGSGIDRAIYTDATVGPISVDLTAGTVTGDASVDADALVSIEQIQGSAFNDIYVATGYTGVSPIGSVPAGFNEFEGMAGDDLITGNGNTQLAYLNATDGVTVDIAAGTAHGTAPGDLANVGNDTFSGVQVVRGSEFADALYGSNNAAGQVEVFQGRGGDDFIDGRGGFDRALYSFRTDDNVTGGITVNMAAGTVIGDASVGTDTLRSIEAARGTNFDDTYNAAGFTASSTNAGSAGVNNVGAAFNEFEGLGGDDSITGNGNTRISYINAADGVTVDLLAGTAQGTAAGDLANVGNDTFTGVNAVQGSWFADTLYGSNNPTGTSEVFDGGAGNDTFDGRGGFDQAVYNVALGTVSGISVDMATGTVVGDASIGTDTQISIESVRGTNFADTYNASGFNGASADLPPGTTFNEFEGMGGNDTITGNGNTRLSYVSATGGVTVDLATGTATGDGSVGTDTFSGVSRARGSNFNDTILGDGNNNTLESQNGNDVLDGRGGNDTLIGGSGTDTFVYGDSYGADIVTDFNPGQGDRIDLSAVTGIYSLADVQTIATQSGPNTVIDFGGGNTLTLDNVTLASLTASNFVFTPHITGDLALTVVKGDSVPVSPDDYSFVVITANDFHAVYPGTPATQITFTVSDPTHGWVALVGAPATPITNFTEAQLEAGLVVFVHDGSDTTQATFKISASDGVDPATPPTTVIVTVPSFTITVQNAAGLDFMNDNTIESIGSGVVQNGGTSSTFTVVNIAANRDFVFEGAGFVYGAGNAITGGTIFAFHVLAHDTQIPLAEFNGRVDAAEFFASAVAQAAGDQSLFNALTAQWTSTFIGAGGDDSFGAGDNNDFFRVSGGNDTFNGGFGFDRANYTSAAGPIDVLLGGGTVTKYADTTKTSVAGVDVLQSIENVTGTDFRDTFNAVGFSASSPNAGSTVTFNTAGTRNEFEGRGGDDAISGNGNTRISYLHATAAVTVTFSSWVSGQGASGTAIGNSSVGTDTFTGVNGVRGSYFDDVFIGSNNAPNTAEFFEGRGGNDLINGGGGFDKASYFFEDSGIFVHMAAGTVVGGANTGTDTLLSVESVIGTDFADTYTADSDPLSEVAFGASSANAGSSGAFNEFEGAGGNDTITGNGNTRVAFYDATAGVTVTLGANGSGTSFGTELGDLADVGTDTFVIGVKDVRGSEFGDIITGNGGNNILEGQGGNDTVNGRGGDDTLTGGSGSDIFAYNTNVFNGNLPASNNDTITDFDGSDGDRIDLRGIAGINSFADILAHVPGGSPNTIQIDATDNLTINVPVSSLQASDFTFNGQVAITVQTSDGYNFSALYDDMAGSIGAINVVDGSHFTATNAARGLMFNITVSGDTTPGNPLTGTVNAIDIYDLSGHILANTNGWNFLASDLNNALLTYVADPLNTSGLDAIFGTVSYSAVGNFVGINAFNNDSINLGSDTFLSGIGDDTFNGLTNTNGDFFNGGDTVDYSHAPGGVTVSLLLQGVEQDTIGAGTDTLINIESLRGSGFNDTLTSNGGSSVLEGDAGDDILVGQVGGNETVSYQHATDSVTVDMVSGTADGNASVGHDTISNFEIVHGSAYADILIGSDNSVLEGGAGGDQLIGNVIGNDASITASYQHATAGVTVSLLNPGANTGEAAGDTFVFASSVQGQHFNLQGSQFNDTLIGDNNNNVLNGWGTRDSGSDTLTGNGGADTFVFSGGRVTITDFNYLQNDKIDLSFLNFGTGISETELQSLISNAAPGSQTLDFGSEQTMTINVTVSSLQLGDFLGLHA